MGFDPRDVAKEVTRRHDAAHPQSTARDVKEGELATRHLRHARHKGREGAHKGHEARSNQGHTAVAFVKRMGLVKGAAIEKLRVFPSKHLRPEEATNRVIRLVTRHRSSQ